MENFCLLCKICQEKKKPKSFLKAFGDFFALTRKKSGASDEQPKEKKKDKSNGKQTKNFK